MSGHVATKAFAPQTQCVKGARRGRGLPRGAWPAGGLGQRSLDARCRLAGGAKQKTAPKAAKAAEWTPWKDRITRRGELLARAPSKVWAPTFPCEAVALGSHRLAKRALYLLATRVILMSVALGCPSCCDRPRFPSLTFTFLALRLARSIPSPTCVRGSPPLEVPCRRKARLQCRVWVVLVGRSRRPRRPGDRGTRCLSASTFSTFSTRRDCSPSFPDSRPLARLKVDSSHPWLPRRGVMATPSVGASNAEVVAERSTMDRPSAPHLCRRSMRARGPIRIAALTQRPLRTAQEARSCSRKRRQTGEDVAGGSSIDPWRRLFGGEELVPDKPPPRPPSETSLLAEAQAEDRKRGQSEVASIR